MAGKLDKEPLPLRNLRILIQACAWRANAPLLYLQVMNQYGEGDGDDTVILISRATPASAQPVGRPSSSSGDMQMLVLRKRIWHLSKRLPGRMGAKTRVWGCRKKDRG